MQAIEFESVVGIQSIALPAQSTLQAGQAVRVVVMYEPIGTEASRNTTDRLSELVAHPESVSNVSDPISSSWDDVVWREKWTRPA